MGMLFEEQTLLRELLNQGLIAMDGSDVYSTLTRPGLCSMTSPKSSTRKKSRKKKKKWRKGAAVQSYAPFLGHRFLADSPSELTSSIFSSDEMTIFVRYDKLEKMSEAKATTSETK